MTRCPAGYTRVVGTDVAIARLGFGCARVFGGSEARASARLIETALEMGIRHFDTAPAYAFGQSEGVLSSVLAGVSDATITTKVGVPPGAGRPHRLSVLYRRTARPLLARTPKVKLALLGLAKRLAPARAENAARRVLARDEIMQGLEGSLERLRRDRIDLFLVHEPDDLDIEQEARETFGDLQGQGLIGAFGLAWGRIVREPVAFGRVVQSQHDPEGPAAGVVVAVKTRIYHGVLRHAVGAKREPAKRIRSVLETHPEAVVIFSASSPRQIREIAEACSGCTVTVGARI